MPVRGRSIRCMSAPGFGALNDFESFRGHYPTPRRLKAGMGPARPAGCIVAVDSLYVAARASGGTADTQASGACARIARGGSNPPSPTNSSFFSCVPTPHVGGEEKNRLEARLAHHVGHDQEQQQRLGPGDQRETLQAGLELRVAEAALGRHPSEPLASGP
jgi:hypothetical protein